MLEFFEVELEEELAEDLKQTNEINQPMLNRIGLQKVNLSWTYKGGNCGGAKPSGIAEQEDDEIPTPTVRPLVIYQPQAQRDESMTSFERLMISRMDDIT